MEEKPNNIVNMQENEDEEFFEQNVNKKMAGMNFEDAGDDSGEESYDEDLDEK